MSNKAHLREYLDETMDCFITNVAIRLASEESMTGETFTEMFITTWMAWGTGDLIGRLIESRMSGTLRK